MRISNNIRMTKQTTIRWTRYRKLLLDKLTTYATTAKEDLEHLFLTFPKCYWKTIDKFIDIQQERWNVDNVEYCLSQTQKYKLATVIYNPTYIMYKYSISENEAIELIAKYKRDKATSKDGFIRRHGKDKGNIKFKKFQITSKGSSDKLKDALIKEHGEEIGMELISKEYQSRSKASPTYYLHRNITSDYNVAYELARNWNIQNAGISKQYYINLGYDEDELDAIISKLNSKKKNHCRNRKYLLSKYGKDWVHHYKIAADKYRNKMESDGHWIPLKDLDTFRAYKQECNFWTNITLVEHKLPNIESRGTDYHLDHMFSQKAGFVENVSPKIVGSKYNLKIIPSKLNVAKRAKCSISLETLLNLYENQDDN